jgi:hypothetical protein
MNKSIYWKPLAGSQTSFLTCPFYEVLFDGTRGNGKTEALLMSFAKGVGRGWGTGYRGVLFRCEYKELEDVVVKSKRLFFTLFPTARFLNSKSDYKWIFPDGEELLLRAAKTDDDYWSYHGHEYAWLGFEELTNWATPDFYFSMHSCVRNTTNSDIPRMIRATTNPYGLGHHWVKARFIEPAPAKTPHGEFGREICRIQGHLKENSVLLEKDPYYIKTLESIENPNKKKAWLEGSWDIVAGSFFGDVWDTAKHVIKPFNIPSHWVRFRTHDWGSSAPFAVQWIAVADGSILDDGRYYPAGALVVYREWYGADSQDKGLKLTVEQLAQGILDRETPEERAKIKYSVADPAIFKVDGGESQYERFGKCGVHFNPADNSRVAGWDSLRSRLIGEDYPMIYFFDTCRHTINTLPTLLPDEHKIEDIDTTQNDHLADSLRYGCMSRPYYLTKPKEADILARPTVKHIFEKAIRRNEQKYYN